MYELSQKNDISLHFFLKKRGSTCTEGKNTRLEENQRYEYGRDPKVVTITKRQFINYL